MSKEAIVPAASQAMYDNFHFAPAIKSGDTLFCSGVIGTRSDGSAPEDPEEQFTLAFQGVETVLKEAGLGFDHIVEMTTYHVGLQKHIQAFLKVKDQFIKEPYPAWTAIGITELAVPGGILEIRVTAKV